MAQRMIEVSLGIIHETERRILSKFKQGMPRIHKKIRGFLNPFVKRANTLRLSIIKTDR